MDSFYYKIEENYITRCPCWGTTMPSTSLNTKQRHLCIIYHSGWQFFTWASLGKINQVFLQFLSGFSGLLWHVFCDKNWGWCLQKFRFFENLLSVFEMGEAYKNWTASSDFWPFRYTVCDNLNQYVVLNNHTVPRQ